MKQTNVYTLNYSITIRTTVSQNYCFKMT